MTDEKLIAKAYPRWIVEHDGPEIPWEQESEALKNEYRAMMRVALVAAQGAAPVLPSSGVDEDKLTKVVDKALIGHGEMAGMSNQERWDARDDIARAVAEWLEGQGR